MVVQVIVFLTLSTLICRGTDISKCFSESLGIRDNKIRLYMNKVTKPVVNHTLIISKGEEPQKTSHHLYNTCIWTMETICMKYQILFSGGGGGEDGGRGRGGNQLVC